MMPITEAHRRKTANGAKSYWASMTKEQRSAEMRRRLHKSRINGKPMGRSKQLPKMACPICEREITAGSQFIRHLKATHDMGKREAKRVIASIEAGSQPTLNGNGTQPATHQHTEEAGTTADYSNDISYLYGRVESEIQHYAHSNGIPVTALTAGISAILRNQTGRQVLGTKHRLPVSQMPRHTA
jgi:hypothetical protein